MSAVLEALGYTVLRELEEGDGPSRLRWAVNRLSRRHKLTAREQEILERVLAGRNNEDISKDLEISRATVKWHMHNIFAKSNTGNRESLLRQALQLGANRSEGVAESDAPVVRQAELKTEPHTGSNLKIVEPRQPIPAAAVPSKSWF
ncbi:helix-turn-helix transcriptional regulator [Enhygromyxa salina]|uniref:helix-turn-helix transcriptional regulator n=1 Tax=Enhygromyxa salina TaxID=215803 RepID=UPI0024680B32|nr:helix-turn-helix transcriptional regulator [Enhygromyxa salina]